MSGTGTPDGVLDLPGRQEIHASAVGYVAVWCGDVPGESIWTARAARLLEQALDEIHSEADPLVTMDLARAALLIEAGELPASEVDGFPFPGEDDEDEDAEDNSGDDDLCTCPPDLMARGGWASTCPVCGIGRWLSE